LITFTMIVPVMKWIPFEVNFAAYKCRMIDPLHLVQPKHSVLSQAIAWY
jgi:hypothetical protein